MCKLNVSVENEYVYLRVKNKTVKYYVPNVLEKYISLKSFDKESGILTLVGRMHLLNGVTVDDEDWIDLHENLSFAFKNPQEIINEIDKVEIA